MKTKSALFLTLFAAILTSCSNDSNGNATPVEDDNRVEEGGACTTDNDCKEGLKCLNEICSTPEETPECTKDEDCGSNRVCKAGKCENKPEETPDPECETNDDCDGDRVCNDGKCEETEPDPNRCATDEDCEKGNCLDDKCRITVGAGEECDNDTMLCETGLSCIDELGSSRCRKLLALGDDCSEDYVTCEDAECDLLTLTCIKTVEEGAECNDSTIVCPKDLVCHQGKCRKQADKDGACDENTPCSDSAQVCFDGKCTTTTGECKTDSDCNADTYCCAEDKCAVKNICIPYGEGPRGNVNETCAYQTVPGLFEADIQCEWLGNDPNDPYPGFNWLVVLPIVAKTPHETGGANTIIAMTYKNGHKGNGGKCDSRYVYSEANKDKYKEWKDGSKFDRCRVNGRVITEDQWKKGLGTYDEDDPYDEGVIRFINGETCELLESLNEKTTDPTKDAVHFHGGMPPSVADVDNDGNIEIFVQQGKVNQNDGARKIFAYHWDDKDKKYKRWWTSSANVDGDVTRTMSHTPLSIHDINDDGIPEIIDAAGNVLNAITGKFINRKNGNTLTRPSMGEFPTVADLDGDGKIEILQNSTGVTTDTSGIPSVFEWDSEKNSWVADWKAPARNRTAQAYGDFGTPGATPEEFDWEHLDGKPEFVTASGSSTYGYVYIDAMYEDKDGNKIGQRIFDYGGTVSKDPEGLLGGGAPTVGDFDGDGLPEVAVAFGDAYTVFDPRCKTGKEEGCKSRGVLWSKKSQDKSSYMTGSSLFDFDGDGATEVVYADECYTRVYDGKTGEVHFSSRTNSRTWREMPIIVDVDNDQSAEIIVSANQKMSCDTIDPIHRGVKCVEDADCTSKKCENGLCRCTEDAQCNWRIDGNGKVLEEYHCADPLAEDKAINATKVCRARHEYNDQTNGIRVMRDKLDRWVSSRNIWNQQSYTITNINDDQTIPKTSDWKMNFNVPGLNNYRANSQGTSTSTKSLAPDITGKLDKDNLCKRDENKVTLTGVVCNRGTKTVGSKMPASFYEVLDNNTLGRKFCTAYTTENVPVGGCSAVSCTLEDITTGIRVRMISNDDGNGGRTTVECNNDNNTDETVLDSCPIN